MDASLSGYESNNKSSYEYDDFMCPLRSSKHIFSQRINLFQWNNPSSFRIKLFHIHNKIAPHLQSNVLLLSQNCSTLLMKQFQLKKNIQIYSSVVQFRRFCHNKYDDVIKFLLGYLVWKIQHSYFICVKSNIINWFCFL